jgi:hypothetical protein
VLVKGRDLGDRAARLFRVLASRAKRHSTPATTIGYWAGIEAGSRVPLG